MKLALLGAMVAGCALVSAPAFAQISRGSNEVYGSISLDRRSFSDGSGGAETTSLDWRSRYERFITDRLSVGPILEVFTTTGSKTQTGLGGSVAFHFGSLSAAAVPFVEVNGTRGFGDQNYINDGQFVVGLKLPIGGGARLKVGPYYYIAKYDRATHGYSSFHSVGLSWSIGLLWK